MKKAIRTVKIDITSLLSKEQIESIKKTALAYAQAFDEFARVSCYIQSTNFNELHKSGYKTIHELVPNLPTAILQCAGKNAGACVKSYNSNNKDKKWQYKGSHKGKNFKVNTCSLSRRGNLTTFSTVDKRVRVLHKLPKWFDEKYPNKRIYSGCVKIKDEHVVLCLSYDIGEIIQREIDENTVVGIDRGIYHPIATSTGLLISSKKSYSVKRRYAHNVSTLKQKSTSSSRRRLRSMKGKEKRFNNDYNHVISKIISELPNVSCIVFEDLTGVSRNKQRHSKKFNRWLHSWSFKDLESKIAYKCEMKGISVKYVSPYLTSQRCSCCGATDSLSRNGNKFKCVDCGYEEHADINASKNIRDKYLVNLRNWLRSHSTDHDVSGALVSD